MTRLVFTKKDHKLTLKIENQVPRTLMAWQSIELIQIDKGIKIEL